MERLTIKLPKGYIFKKLKTVESAKRYIELIANKLGSYEDAEEKGKLMILPCKRGDILYVLTCDSPTGIEKTKCENIYINKKNELVIIAPSIYDDWGNAKWNFKCSDFDKRVFLSQIKAEQAYERGVRYV